MENLYHSDFEDLIKDKADQYKMYPSDKVWKNINRSLRSRRKWYWTAFALLLSGISYLSIIELMKPAPARAPAAKLVRLPAAKVVTTEQLNPFHTSPIATAQTPDETTLASDEEPLLSDITVEDSGTLTASFDIPLELADVAPTPTGRPVTRGSLTIRGLEPLRSDESYRIDLSLPSPADDVAGPIQGRSVPEIAATASTEQLPITALQRRAGDNWLEDKINLKPQLQRVRKISWQVAFAPTVNYRKLSGDPNAKIASVYNNIPLATQINGDVNSLVNHRPALGFELGTHGFLNLSNRFTLKGGVQFNYSKYDIRAFRAPTELATISLNPDNRGPNTFVSYTDIRNFGGSAQDNLKNQYFQFSLPVGLEYRVLGNDHISFNIAGTVQPTLLVNKNSYLITTDYKNYTRAPSLVRRWNVNAGAEAYLSYTHNGVRWQVGPQFRYQLFSTYDKAYPIREYLMEYGIKVGITKTIR